MPGRKRGVQKPPPPGGRELKKFPIPGPDGEPSYIMGTLAMKVWRLPNNELVIDPVGQLHDDEIMVLNQLAATSIGLSSNMYHARRMQAMARAQQEGAGPEEAKPNIEVATH